MPAHDTTLACFGPRDEDGNPVAREALATTLRQKVAGDVRKLEEHLAALPPYDPEADLWPAMRRQLESAALIEAEALPGIGPPFLRFHPTLQGLLWARLGAVERERLALAHRKRYYALAGYLYHEDKRNPHQTRAIARRELPNLLHAAHAALDAADPDAVDFVKSVNLFLDYFGLKQEAARLGKKAHAMAGDVGSRPWYLARSNRGERLLSEGRVDEARKVFEEILAALGDAPTYERAVTLHRLGRCFESGGRPDLAEARYREALEVLDRLEDSDSVKRQRGIVFAELADLQRDAHRFAESQGNYKRALAAAKESEDSRQEGAVLGNMGTLAMREGKLDEAVERFREALALFQRLGEPAMEAVAWHQLGRVFHEVQQWDEADRHYREAARIKEEQGMIGGRNGATSTWNQLAIVSKNAGKNAAAEDWYRKAIDADRALGDPKELGSHLNNLANLLQGQPGRLAEARALAEEALAIDQTLDPGAAEIWKTYTILAEIADKEAAAATDAARRAALEAEARDHRRRARDAKRAFAGTQHELQRHAPLIRAAVAAIERPELLPALNEALGQREQDGWTNLVSAIRQILAGGRDGDALCEGLDLEDSMIVETILHALDDPSVLEDFQPASPPSAPGGASSAGASQPARIKETLASLPPAVRGALEAGDVAQLQAALADLPEAEAAAIIEALETAGIIGRRPDATPHPPGP